MQNHKMKKAVFALAMFGAVSAFAQTVSPPQPVVGSGGVPIQVAAPMLAPPPTPSEVLVFGNSAQPTLKEGSRLEEMTSLRYEKQKLEVKKEIAKLKTEIEDIESGANKKSAVTPAGTMPMPPPQMMQMMSQPKQPSQEELVFNSVFVSSIFGTSGSLTAEVNSAKGKVIGKVGTVIHTGEVITEITSEHVVLTKNKKRRILTPSSAASAPIPQGPQSSQASAPPAPFFPPAMSGFMNPADLLSASTPQGPPVGPPGQQQNGKAPPGL
jgi:hypothetical protein